jgi:hypothetical protein
MPGKETITQQNPDDSKETSSKNIETRILKNFYLSFKFSQGRTDIQEALLKAVSIRYNREELSASFGKKLEFHHEKLYSKVENLSLPKVHANSIEGKQIMNDDVKDEFGKQWGYQVNMLNDILEIGEQNGNDLYTEELLKPSYHDLLIRMIDRDIIYMNKTRPKREFGKSDPHESYVKTYIIDQKPTGSDEFNELFQEIRSLAINTNALNKNHSFEKRNPLERPCQNLIIEWEKTHPGQKFIE